jgi:DNA-binding transcriptional regulator YiaG
MPNLAAPLKAEISRVARKELRTATEQLKKVVATQRSEIAGLKRRVQELEKQAKAQSRAVGLATKQSAASLTADSADFDGLRFRAAGMASNRKRLGLSAHDFGLLVGATGQSVYAWEQGKSKPRASSLAAIATLRGVGKREVSARLDALKQPDGASGST